MRYQSALFLLTAIVFVSSQFQVDCCGDDAEYRLTFVGEWNQQPLPNGAHFTPLIGATHGSPGAVFSVGSLASQGVENVAETGSTPELIGEINAGIAGGTIGSLISRPGNIDNVQTITFDFTVSSDHSLLTILTMIAPSPDWFVGLRDFELRPNSVWIDEITLELNSYDAGTENGSTFSLSNPPTNPQGLILPLDSAEPDGPLFGVGSVASITLTRTDVDLFALGDVNNDGDVNLLDVQLFVVFVSSQTFFPAADINCDGAVNLLDVAPFVELLAGN